VQRLAVRLGELRRAEGVCLFAELVDAGPGCRPRLALLVRDTAQDAWVYAAPAGGGPAALWQRLQEAREAGEAAAGVPPEAVVIGPALAVRLAQPSTGLGLPLAALLGQPEGAANPAAAPAGWAPVRPVGEGPPLALWSPDPAGFPAQAAQALAAFLARARPAAPELAFFSLAGLEPPLRAGASFDLAVSLLAAAALKTFALRLLGFHWSSAAYLYENFLAGASQVQVDAGRIEVSLPRSPLDIVMRMGGVDGRTCAPPWLGGCEVMLRLP
jgi:hypothetical protein